MRRTQPTPWPQFVDPRIPHLERELRRARRAVEALLPASLQEHVEVACLCDTQQAGYAWEHEFVRRAIACAVALPPRHAEDIWPRACCPLCGSASSSWYHRGFALPGGLERHLYGELNAAWCPVVEVVFGMAREEWGPRFRETEAAQAAAQQATRERSLATEPLIVVAEDGSPGLRDEGLSYDGKPRDDAGWAWAEARLAALGFETVHDDRVTSYRRVAQDYAVYADPRRAGRITFRIAEPAAETAKRRGKQRERRRVSFEIPDRFTRDLPKRFEALVAEAVGKLTAPPKSAQGRA